MKQPNKLAVPLFLLIAISFTSSTMVTGQPSQQEIHLNNNQLNAEIEASKKQFRLELQQTIQEIEQDIKAYSQTMSDNLDSLHRQQLALSADIKELLRREGL
ncbi:hypothetical protein ACPV40_16815 [Vibrio alfacsensis]|uniref:hypothetical protein n=1 Tax=Vibrio TaxID=662 RepID=UPI0040685F23